MQLVFSQGSSITRLSARKRRQPLRADSVGSGWRRIGAPLRATFFAAGGAHGYLPPEHFDQIFSAHGTIMIFFMAMPFVIGIMNYVVPLQLGVRDMAFPTLNSMALWLTASGILLTSISLAVGEFAQTGWVAYPPLSEVQYSPGVGVELWALQISGVSTLMTGVNFVTTILKMRAPG